MKKQSTYIFLPTEKEIESGDLVKLPNGKVQIMSENDMIDYLDSQSSATNPQYLYILSEEGISEGDWILHKNQVHQVNKNRGLYLSVDELSSIDIRTDLCKKVIATTDPKLTQDRISMGVQHRDDKILRGLPKITPSDIEYIISLYNGVGKGVDVRDSANRLSNITKKLHNRTDEYCEGARDGFILGYNQCLTDNARKEFTETELWMFVGFYNEERKQNKSISGSEILNDFKNKAMAKSKNRDTIMVEYEEFTEEGHQIVTAPRLKLQGGCIVISRG